MNGKIVNLKLGMLYENVFFKKMIITEKKENSLSFIHNPLRVKRLTYLRLQFSHLNKHKLKPGFWDTWVLCLHPF